MWERGLKLAIKLISVLVLVAPHVGAWIETEQTTALERIFWSLPMWERGLKLIVKNIFGLSIVSLPMWERGLKHIFS